MLFYNLLEHMSLIAVAAFVFSKLDVFKRLIKDKLEVPDKIIMVVFFSITGIIGTYMGVTLKPYALANTRPIGVIAAGYIGGPLIGFLVGTIAGIHRYALGGFTAFACGFASAIEGLIGGLGGKFSKNRDFNIITGILSGIAAEVIQMIIILIFAKPFSDALMLVKTIALPMIFANSLGVGIFVLIIKNAKESYNKDGAILAQEVLNIAKKTVVYMKHGFNEATAAKVTEIIHDIGNFKGVFICNKETVLSYYGCDIEKPLLLEQLEEYYKNPDCRLIKFKNGGRELLFLCTPILVSDYRFEGILGLNVKSSKEIDRYFVDFSKELSSLLASQIEHYRLSKLANAASTAELRALRAQIHPHFLFNALNTIVSFCRTDPQTARELIIDLSNFFRKTLNREDDFVALGEEIDLIKSYLAIEKARLGARLEVLIDIPDELMGITLPIFSLQPLVENSVKHGISPKVSGGSIFISVKEFESKYEFMVKDTGLGMTSDKYKEVMSNWPSIGLKNVNERLRILYGDESQLKITSTFEIGTEIRFLIPKEGGKLNG